MTGFPGSLNVVLQKAVLLLLHLCQQFGGVKLFPQNNVLGSLRQQPEDAELAEKHTRIPDQGKQQHGILISGLNGGIVRIEAEPVEKEKGHGNNP